MPRRVALLLAALLVPTVQAAPTLVAGPTAWTLSLPGNADIPVQLGAGAPGEGNPQFNPHGTGVSAQVDGGAILASNYNTTRILHTVSGGGDAKVRLVYRSHTGDITQCAQCDLQFRRSGMSPSNQITIAGGVTQAAGGNVTLSASDGATPNLYLWAVATRSGLLNDVTVAVTYTLEIYDATSATSLVQYTNMTMRFVV